MPTAPLGVCPHPGCPRRSRGLCPVHLAAKHQATDARRGWMYQRGYDRRWQRFTRAFRHMLLARGVMPKCGARLDGLPSPHSQCVQLGYITIEQLHVDHHPALEHWERSHPERVCDVYRVQLLCKHCHASKTATEMRQR